MHIFDIVLKSFVLQLSIHHRLTYRYQLSTLLGPQRLQLYPRLSWWQTLLDYRLTVDPEPGGWHTHLDLEGNTAQWLYFQQATDRLEVELRLEVDSRSFNPFDFILFPFEATRLPLVYEEPEASILAPYRPPAQAVPKIIADWTEGLLKETDRQTLLFLLRLSETLRQDFTYVIREKGPPHPPEETMNTRRGSCRDLSLLMISACHSVGLAARFVSGYAWGADSLPSHELHAWVEVYLPGAGWHAFDPTMGGAVAETHVALAASAEPMLVAPLRGAYWGEAASELETEVVVERRDSLDYKP